MSMTTLVLLLVLGQTTQPATQPTTAPATQPAATQPAVDAGSIEGRFLANIQQVTDEGKSGEGYFSPDGSKIIYQAVRGDHPFYQMFVRDLKTGEEQMISTGEGFTTCGYFHPTEDRLIFASSHLDPDRAKKAEEERIKQEEIRQGKRRRSYNWDFDNFVDIFEADLDGGNLNRITSADGYDAEGGYSPDGKQIAFCSTRTGKGDIYVMDRDGSNVRRITDGDGYEGGPFFSPDGKRIIYRGEVEGKPGLLQLFVINADGTGKTQLTDNDDVNFGPYWHPSGKAIIYATSRHGHRNYELYLMHLDSRKQVRVTSNPAADVLPVFSPDGRKLMWTSRRGKNKQGEDLSQLFIADWVFDVDSLE